MPDTVGERVRVGELLVDTHTVGLRLRVDRELAEAQTDWLGLPV